MTGQRTSARLGALLLGTAVLFAGCGDGSDDRAAPADRGAALSGDAPGSADPTASASASTPPSGSPSPSGSAPATSQPPVSPAVPAEPGGQERRSVTVASPAEGATVTRTFAVTGRAAAVEGTLIWELREGQRVVTQGITQAGALTPEPFRFSVTAPRAGRYTIVVYQEAVKDGSAPRYAVYRTVTVR